MSDDRKPIVPPPGWTDDSLTEFLEAAHWNRFATFVNKPEWCRRLAEIDACFFRVAAGEEWLDPEDILTPLFFFRCHSAYRASSVHAMAGQTTETYPQLRSCLEYAGYALHIQRVPELAEVWLRRHDDEAATRRVRNEFTVSKVRAAIEQADPQSGRVFSELYERTIDFGGHPNERAITGSLAIAESQDRKTFNSVYLHGNGLPLDHALKTTAQVGVCALHVLAEALPARFEELDIAGELGRLREGL